MKWLRSWRRILGALGIVALISPFGIAWWAGSDIASPARRSLLEYHREFLDHPQAHGCRIDRFTAADLTPCLVVSPSHQPADRGRKIRAELSSRGIAVPAFGQIRGTLVLLHGRKGRKEDYLPIAERFCACGFRCVIPDLPAHGEHPGPVATYGVREASLPARILDEAGRKLGFSPHPAGLIGLSMGGSVAIHAASLPDAPWQALGVVATFDSLPEVIRGQSIHRFGRTCGPPLATAAAAVYQFRTKLPLSDIMPIHHAPDVTIPTLVAHGMNDQVAPLEAGDRLYHALPHSTVKRWVPIPDAGHDDVLVTPFPIYAEIAAWMLEHIAPATR